MKLATTARTLATLLLASTTVLAVSQDTPSKQQASEPTGGVVRGHIRFEGELPKVKPLTVVAAQAGGCSTEGKEVDDQDRSLLIDEKRGIANVVVSLTVEGTKVKIPEEPVVFNQRGCRFEPHVMVVPAGSTVNFKNSDGCAHNVHIYCFKNTGFNQTVPAGKDYKAKFKMGESIKVTCDIHPWMTGYVVVTQASHWAITGADGSFALKGVPPGTYELQIWQEKLGRGKTTVTVAADGSCDPIEVKMAPKKPRRRRR